MISSHFTSYGNVRITILCHAEKARLHNSRCTMKKTADYFLVSILTTPFDNSTPVFLLWTELPNIVLVFKSTLSDRNNGVLALFVCLFVSICME